MSLAQRRFAYADQTQFASVSGDYNPMHLDALQARRTQAGAPVVHGIHLLLWALDSLAAAQPNMPPMRKLRAHFSKFIYLEDNVEVVLADQTSSRVRLNVSVDGAPRSKVSIDFGEPSQDCSDWSDPSLEVVPFSNTALDLTLEQIANRSGRLSFVVTSEDASALFPAATRWLGAQRVAAIAATTRLVGMVCPGLHSIYSELSIRSCAESTLQDSLAFRVTDADARFRSVQMEIVGGGVTGTIESTARVPPVQQATMQSLAGVVGHSEFARSVSLIVGGSRGLGELTAKLIAAGGGRVIVTWQSGKDDAERVAQEIRAAGGVCDTLAYDARRPAAAQLALLAATPTHAYYFATPAIFRPQSDIFVVERLQEFLAVYVDGFWQLSQALRSLQPAISIFYPSSVSVSERPRGMTEYTMAKTAGEVLCADLNEAQSPLRITVVRLPRLATDQTASAAATETASALDTMLPIVREVQHGSRP
jgi:NAD(P)-dependent dehydrogenase (short-subunit alcohol dehydrogenase family)